MSDQLAAAAAALGAPPELVARSAAARATAQGVSADEILAAWAGGAPVAPAAPPAESAPAPTVESAAAPEATAPSAEPAVTTPEPAVTAAPAATAVLERVAVQVEEPEEDIVAPTLIERIPVPAKLGGALGFMLGMFGLVASTPFLYDKVTLGGSADDPFIAWSIQPGRAMLFAAVVSGVFGAIVARLAGIVPAWFDRSLTVATSGRSLSVMGAAAGAVLGVVGAGVLLAVGTPVDVLPDEPAATLVPVIPSLVLVLLGGTILGSGTAILAQVMAMPAFLPPEEAEEAEEIKHRLGTSYMMPVVVMLGIIIPVVAFGLLLLEFHTMAPLIAIVTSGGILTFAFLAGGRPGVRVSLGEVLVAGAGIGTVVLFIVLVTNAASGG